MKLKDLFNVLLGAQDVRIFSAGAISMWEGEFKEIPHEYFDKLIDTMYSCSWIKQCYCY